jgi:U3 small nucleolar RNA-associated protein 12
VEFAAGLAFVGANESILCWDIRKGQLLGSWKANDCTAEVTLIVHSPIDDGICAAGYEDGSIRVWDFRMDTPLITFNGHKSAVTALVFHESGAHLASGAKDTNIIVWDLLNESALFKLRGHKDQVTGLQFSNLHEAKPADIKEDLQFDESNSILLSTGKDALIKVWDLTSQHCIETHVTQTNGECWALALAPDNSACITSGNDGELRLWAIDPSRHKSSDKHHQGSENILRDIGILYRQGRDRTVGLHFHHSGRYVAVHGSEKAIEVLKVLDQDELKKSVARKRKRRREKTESEGKTVDINREDEADIATEDMIRPIGVVRLGGKIRAMAWMKSKDNKKLHLLAGTASNMLEHYEVTKGHTGKLFDSNSFERVATVELPAHRSDIRSLALSSDDKMLASVSNGNLKIWNVRTKNCLRTLECGYALCCTFIPGDKVVLVGTKEGNIEMFDIASSILLTSIEAHDGPVWTMDVHPSGRSIITGGADKTVKFWNFELDQQTLGSNHATTQLRLQHIRTLKLGDDVLKISFSPDSRLLAVSTLDYSVKVFFTDSLKLFLTLYGHKLPVLDMSISSDSKLIATCSADKNVRIWGLDFGDCHKAFFAHQDSIMQVSFIPHPVSREDGHIFFSAAKDRLIKTFDGDKFEQIQKLGGHHGEIWAMVVSRTGDFVITASHDKSIRIWQRTDEPIFLEEEREKELEELYESTLQASLERDEYAGEENNDKVEGATKQTVATVTSGERIVEALQLGHADLLLVETWKKQKALHNNVALPQRDPQFMALGGISAETYVLSVLAKIPAPQLQDALLILPFSMLPALFTFIDIWLNRQLRVTLVCRVLHFVLTIYQRQIAASGELKLLLKSIGGNLRNALNNMKDGLGYNLAALRFIELKTHQDHVIRSEFEEAEDKGSHQRKRAFIEVS